MSTTMQRIAYAGWPNCVRLSNGRIELVATTDVGPRVIRLGFLGGQNLFKQYDEMLGLVGGDEWRIYGGHRLWHAPEVKPRTYSADNAAVAWKYAGGALTLTQAVEADTGIAKRIIIKVDSRRDAVTVEHVLTNRNPWAVELSPWVLSVMAPGGRAIFPQEPAGGHETNLLPTRPMVLWAYTDLSDKRWTWGRKYIQLRQDRKARTPQKIGLGNRQGWAAYCLGSDVMVKRFDFVDGATYPDFGCNTETFTNNEMLEVESLGPLTKMQPGASVRHTERWYLFHKSVGTSEAAIDRDLLPLVKSCV